MAATASRGPASGQTQMQTPGQRPQVATTQTQAVLHLRGATREQEGATSTGRRIQWAEDVVDNEGMGKKKSKGLFCPFPLSLSFSLSFKIA